MLNEDSRATTQAIADALNMPRVTVHDRIKRLQERGVIDKFSVEINRRELGWPLHGFILANWAGQREDIDGDKNRRKKVKVRGIKQASKQIQQRLEKDLDALLEDPKIFLPEIKAELGRPRRDMMAASLKEIEYVSKKRHDRKWLARRMVKRRGCMVSRALAGSLLAALDGDHSTVAVFNNPIYGTSSFIRRGNGKQAHQAAIQNYNNHKLRMLASAKLDGNPNRSNSFFMTNGKSSTALSNHIAPIPGSSAKAIAAPPPSEKAVIPTSPGCNKGPKSSL